MKNINLYFLLALSLSALVGALFEEQVGMRLFSIVLIFLIVGWLAYTKDK